MEILFPVSGVFALTTASAAVALSNGRCFLLCNSNQRVAIEVNGCLFVVIRITYRMSVEGGGQLVRFNSLF